MKLRAGVLVMLSACGGAKPTALTSPPKPVATVVSAPVPPPPPVPPSPAATIPRLVPEEFKVDGKTFDRAFVIDGATVVTRENVVGSIAPGDRVEWIAKIPKEAPGIGPTMIEDVGGRFPDSVDVYYEGMGRAPLLTYLPLTGKGEIFPAGARGGSGVLMPARVGDSLLMAMYSKLDSYRIATVRGPKLTRTFQNISKCRPGENENLDWSRKDEEVPIITPAAFESTANGTLVAIGNRCGKEPTAEIWDPGKTTSRLVDIRATWKRIGWGTKLLRGAASDELWGETSSFDDILHYAGGAFALAPHLDVPIAEAFTSRAGQLYVHAADNTIMKLVDGAWQPVAKLAELESHKYVWALSIDANGTFWMNATPPNEGGSRVYRLKEAGQVPAVTPCASWFVHMLTVESQQPPDWTYPTTQKALAGFAASSELHLAEWGYPTQMGIAVKSREQGAAVVAYMSQTTPTLRPKLLCFTPPAKHRDIPVVP